MRLCLMLSLLAVLSLCARAADVCNPRDLEGGFGFQLNGRTNISGESKPAVTLGSLAFDGDGGVSGTASVKYSGLLLGNPVTGTYAASTDCNVTWSLQDDSGAYQHFSGIATPDGRRVRFRQTDPGGAQDGLLVRTAAPDCKSSDLRTKYAFTLSGTMVPMTQVAPSNSVHAKGVMEQDSTHHFRLTLDDQSATDVDLSIESDCTMDMGLVLPIEGDETAKPLKLRGILVDAGREILAIQTDPGAVVSARFTAQ